MLPKQRRISKEFFEKIIKEGKNINSEHIYLRFTKNIGKDSLFSFIISGKIAKKAVDRNLFKRRGRYIIQKNLNNIKAGYLYTFFAKKGVVELSFKVLEQEILFLLSKIN